MLRCPRRLSGGRDEKAAGMLDRAGFRSSGEAIASGRTPAAYFADDLVIDVVNQRRMIQVATWATSAMAATSCA